MLRLSPQSSRSPTWTRFLSWTSMLACFRPSERGRKTPRLSDTMGQGSACSACVSTVWETSQMLSVRQGIEAKVGASMACAISSMEGLSKRKARILARQCGSMLAGRPARRRCGGTKSTWSDAATRQSALREAEQGMRASWTERAEQLSMDREASAHPLDNICATCEAPCLHPKDVQAENLVCMSSEMLQQDSEAAVGVSLTAGPGSHAAVSPYRCPRLQPTLWSWRRCAGRTASSARPRPLRRPRWGPEPDCCMSGQCGRGCKHRFIPAQGGGDIQPGLSRNGIA